MAGSQGFEYRHNFSDTTFHNNVCGSSDSEEEMDTTPAPAATKAKKAGMVKAKEDSEEEEDDDEDDDDDDEDDDDDGGEFWSWKNFMWFKTCQVSVMYYVILHRYLTLWFQ